MICWHCGADAFSDGIGYCPCLFCGLKCQACVGRARTEKELELAERYRLDARNTLDYEVIHNGDGIRRNRRLKFPPGVYTS